MIRVFLTIAMIISFPAAAGISGEAQAVEPTQRVLHIGFVGPESPSTTVRGVDAFWHRLRELGWVEGQNIAIEARWTEGRPERLPVVIAEVIDRKVDVLVTYSTPAAAAASKATKTVPIVVAGMADPVGSGLADSLARPGGNLTGLSLGYGEGFSGKWLEMLREIVPELSTVAVIWNPNNPANRELRRKIEFVAPTSRVRLRFIDLHKPDALDAAFQQARQAAQAVLVLPDPFTVNNRHRVVTLAALHRLPAMYVFRDFVDVGGLMSYGIDQAVLFRRAAEYVDKILKGAKPGDLPIEQPTRLELVVNLTSAKSLGIRIPESIILRADEIIK